MRNAALHYWIAMVLASASLALAAVSVALDRRNRGVQGQLREQTVAVQSELSGLRSVESLSQNILEDMGRVAVTNGEIRVLLAQHGYSLSEGAPGSPRITPETDREPSLQPRLDLSPALPDADSDVAPPSISTEEQP